MLYLGFKSPPPSNVNRLGSDFYFHRVQDGSGIHSASSFPEGRGSTVKGIIQFHLGLISSMHGALFPQHLQYHHGMVLANGLGPENLYGRRTCCLCEIECYVLLGHSCSHQAEDVYSFTKHK